MKVLKFSSLALVAGLLVGCNPPAAPPAAATATVNPLKVNVTSDAGIGATQLQDPKTLMVAELAAARRAGPPRKDPFAMKPDEKAYDIEQSGLRLVSTYGPFEPVFTPPEEPDHNPPVIEDQPYRRLAGVVVGDSVLAIIDMGNGTTELIRPGQQIPNSEWKVVSIDQDKAVLRRNGKTLPHEITVRLESPPGGVGGGTGVPGFGGGQSGRNGGMGTAGTGAD